MCSGQTKDVTASTSRLLIMWSLNTTTSMAQRIGRSQAQERLHKIEAVSKSEKRNTEKPCTWSGGRRRENTAESKREVSVFSWQLYTAGSVPHRCKHTDGSLSLSLALSLSACLFPMLSSFPPYNSLLQKQYKWHLTAGKQIRLQRKDLSLNTDRTFSFRDGQIWQKRKIALGRTDL